MIKPKVTGFFLDISEFGMVAAHANHFQAPLKINSLYESPLLSQDDTREFVRTITNAGRTQVSACYCGFYPQGRFVHRLELDDPMKAREDKNFFATALEDKFGLNIKNTSLVVINPVDGSPFGLPPLPQEVFLCGGPTAQIAQIQERLVDHLIYPDHLEMGTIASMGGFMHYFSHIPSDESTLVIEFSSEGALLLIYRGDRLDNVRMISHGLNSFIPIVQSELGLTNPQDAKHRIFTGEFDHIKIAPLALAALIKELQSFVSFYELQSSTRVSKLFLTLLPPSMQWLTDSICQSLNIQSLIVDYARWLEVSKITLSNGLDVSSLDNRWFNLFSLMTHYSNIPDLSITS